MTYRISVVHESEIDKEYPKPTEEHQRESLPDAEALAVLLLDTKFTKCYRIDIKREGCLIITYLSDGTAIKWEEIK